MINDGSIKDVIKINGLPYPPAYPTLPNTRSQTFLFPRLDNILNSDGGGGALSQMFQLHHETSRTIPTDSLPCRRISLREV